MDSAMWALSAVDWLHVVSGISKGTALLSSISYSYKPSETHWLRPFNKFLQLALCRKGQKLCYTWKGSVGFSQAIFVVLKDCQAVVTAVRLLSRVLMQGVCVCAQVAESYFTEWPLETLGCVQMISDEHALDISCPTSPRGQTSPGMAWLWLWTAPGLCWECSCKPPACLQVWQT